MTAMPPAVGLESSGEREALLDVLQRAVAALAGVQKDDGHFCGELEGDSILESEYLLMKFILGQEHEPLADGSGPEALREIARYLRGLQRADGAWGQYPGSGADLSATVKAYFALKLMGDDPAAPHMRAAIGAVRRGGGAERCNSFTNFYLACLGQISWNAVPAIPPEIVLLPSWSYFHMTKVSAWTRTMILPLSLVVTLRPTRTLPAHLGIDELFFDERERHRLTMVTGAPPAWAAFFRLVDRALKLMPRLGLTPLRRLALERAERWILERAGEDAVSTPDGRLPQSGGLGAIFPPMVYIQIALAACGYRRDHPVIARAERELDALFLRDDRGIRIQPCFSPVWDSGIALYALTEAGLTERDEPVARVARWLREKECRHVGDWAANVRGDVPASGWYFEYDNDWYPDVDDTAMVAMALRRAGGEENRAAAQRGVAWILAMQNDDGGWAAFDRTRHRPILEYVPFADHNAMQDPSCPDITGRVLECLSWHGFTVRDEVVQRAIAYIQSRQEREGCFFGRWGVNYVYGTWQAVVGPIRCGADPSSSWLERAGTWLKSIQRADGSFGETASSYEDAALKGTGPSTASQTAWAAMTLQAIFGPRDPDLARAIAWLSARQLDERGAADRAANPDGDPPGSWVEREFTGTGFPRVFYLRYHLYRLYFPLMAIGRYLAAHGLGLGAPERVKVAPKPSRRTAMAMAE
jgi:squalene-hopene/tetraprenyl-beta-curcumene cyclase